MEGERRVARRFGTLARPQSLAVADTLAGHGANVSAKGTDGKLLRARFTECGAPCGEIAAWFDR